MFFFGRKRNYHSSKTTCLLAMVVGVMLFVCLPSAVALENLAVHPTGCMLLDENNVPFKPSTLVRSGSDLYFLGPDCLWCARNGWSKLAQAKLLSALKIAPPPFVGKVPPQEFSNCVYFAPHRSLVVLDKSGDLFEYLPDIGKWKLYRANEPFVCGQPDPEFIDLCSTGAQIALLDPERNQIWKAQGANHVMQGYFKDVLPWRVKPGNPVVSDAISIAYDAVTYVLKSTGCITRYGGAAGSGRSFQIPFAYRPVHGLRPSRLITANGLPLYVVERENNRVLAVDKTSGSTVPFLFSQASDLRGLIADNEGFWIIDGNELIRRNLRQHDSLLNQTGAKTSG